MNNGNANGDSLSGEESENIGKTANVSANHRRPAPPKMGRPAPPKTGPPAPPKVGRPAPPNRRQSSDLNSQIGEALDSDPVLQKAKELEDVGEYNEAAIYTVHLDLPMMKTDVYSWHYRSHKVRKKRLFTMVTKS